MKKLFVGNYRISHSGQVDRYKWFVLPSVGVEVDNRSLFLEFHFLCLYWNVNIEHLKDLEEWEQRISEMMKQMNEDK